MIRSDSRPPLGWLLVLFMGSGCAALIYEVVWLQLLQLVVGSSAVSLGLLLGTYMGGLCIGSLALPHFVSARNHPLRLYAVLELGIGTLGVLVLSGIPFVSRVYVATATEAGEGILVRGIICALCLLPPTILMGATLPAVSRWLETTPEGMAQLGFCYGANIAGAIFGCVLAGFYLLRVYDLALATYVAVAINVMAALAAFGLSTQIEYRPAANIVRRSTPRVHGYRFIYLAMGLSGLAALGAQVIWTRLLSMMLGVTVYTFSIILAVFLIGLGIGANAGSFLARKTSSPRLAFGVSQMLLAGGIAWTAYMLANVLPYWPIDPWLSINPWFNFQVDLLRTGWVTLPATVLWGASFPLALSALAARGQDPGRVSGEAYAANTLGAIVGAVAFSIVFIPWLGPRASQQLLIGLSAFAAVIVIAPAVGWRGLGWLTVATGISVLLLLTVADTPWPVVAYGHRIASTLRAFQLYPNTKTHLLYRGDGMSTSIAITESDTGQRSYHVNGKTEATTLLDDMRLQRMLGHIPALVHPNPRSVLSWGFGAGVTVGSFVVYPGIERMVICELEALVPPASDKYFGRENYNVLHDPRTEVIYDDARHHLFTAKEKFDVITSDPLDPWAKGTAALYTREFFEEVRRHLNPGGMFAQFVQLYESNDAAVKSELATFFDVFPAATVWSNNVNGGGFDLVLLGRTTADAIDVDQIQQRLDRPDYAAVVESLNDVGFHSAVELLATYVSRPSDLEDWLKGAELNRDRNLRLQYLGGLGVNAGAHESIYAELLNHRRFPGGLFAGSIPRIQLLRSLLLPHQ